jgi:hypothetical protein
MDAVSLSRWPKAIKTIPKKALATKGAAMARYYNTLKKAIRALK